MTELVDRNEYMEVLYDDRGGDTLLITFNELFYKANGKNFWGEGPARKAGVSALGFVSTSRNWFPSQGMSQAPLDILSRYRRRILYGFSQGAYAAIRYSGLLNADVVLAFSPQFTIEPRRAPTRQFAKYYRPDWHDGMQPHRDQVKGKIFIAADPFCRTDHINALLFQAALDCAVVPCFFMGHSSVRAVASTAQLKALLDWANTCDPAPLRSILHSRRRSCPDYYTGLALVALRSKHRDFARQIIDKGQALFPDDPSLAIFRERRLQG